MPRIFASGVFGSDYDLWGAWSFTDRGTRDRLAETISDEDWCLAIGMTSTHSPVHERGRLLALLKIGPELIRTQEMVEPEHWRRTVELHGPGKWLYGFPIKYVERFEIGPDGLPRRRETPSVSMRKIDICRWADFSWSSMPKKRLDSCRCRASKTRISFERPFPNSRRGC